MKSWRASCVETASLASIVTLLTTVGAASDVRVSTSDAAEFPNETAAIVEATAAFFSEIQTDASPAPLLPEIRIEGGIARQIAFAEGGSTQRALDDSHGPLAQLTGYRISWYPVDRFLGAVDFMGTYGDAQDLVCGYLVWDVSDPDLPVLDEVVADYVISADVAALPADEAQARLLNANCAHGGLAQNYSFLDITQ